MSYNDFIDERLKDLGRQASFHQMYVGEAAPYVDPVIYKNTEISTEKVKKILGLDFAGNAELRMFANRIHDQMEEQTRRLTNRIMEIQDMKFRKWLYTVVLSDFGYDFIGCQIKPIKQNAVKLINLLTDDFLILHIERTEIAVPTNHWMELEWELYQHGTKIKEGRDFLNMEVKVNWS